MGNSYSAEVWLDERRWDALEAALEEQGTNIEKYLQDYLVDLYREMVPADQVREIESCIKQERQEELREAEARKVFSVFRLWDGGKSRCLATEYPKEFLDVARGSCVSACRREMVAPTPLPEKSMEVMTFLWSGLMS